MNKVDRIILIFIGFGIWALVILHFIEPNSVVAHGYRHLHTVTDIDEFEEKIRELNWRTRLSETDVKNIIEDCRANLDRDTRIHSPIEKFWTASIHC